ncbi:TolC family protein [Oxalobacteraceae bacterium]|nr:TolC family protein [Oxalobacteraceae bacterium]
MHHLYQRAAAPALALLLAGCASFSPDGGFDSVAKTSRERSGQDTRLLRSEADIKALDAAIGAMLAQPLSADDAVRIALLNNRGLQASYWSLGIAEADLVQAGRLQNPSFGFQRTAADGAVDIDRSLTVSLVQLLTMPLASRIEAGRFEQTKLSVANAALQVAAEARRAYYDAVGAAQSADYAAQVEASASASAELAGRMRKAGNWSQLDLAREQAYHAQTAAEVLRARQAAVAAREKLTRTLGLSGRGAEFSLPDRLPDLPAAPRTLDDIEQLALRERLDIQAATLDTRQTASALGLTRGTRFINVLELGAVRNSGAGQPSARGYALTLEVPLFDWGGSRVARAEATYMQSVNRLAETAANARSEARERYADYRSAYALAVHYRDEVLPQRKRISDETLLRYNGMLLSVFELLADAREQASAVNAAIGAQRDFWVAHTSLESALGGRLPPTGTTPQVQNGAAQ